MSFMRRVVSGLRGGNNQKNNDDSWEDEMHTGKVESLRPPATDDRGDAQKIKEARDLFFSDIDAVDEADETVAEESLEDMVEEDVIEEEELVEEESVEVETEAEPAKPSEPKPAGAKSGNARNRKKKRGKNKKAHAEREKRDQEQKPADEPREDANESNDEQENIAFADINFEEIDFAEAEFPEANFAEEKEDLAGQPDGEEIEVEQDLAATDIPSEADPTSETEDDYETEETEEQDHLEAPEDENEIPIPSDEPNLGNPTEPNLGNPTEPNPEITEESETEESFETEEFETEDFENYFTGGKDSFEEKGEFENADDDSESFTFVNESAFDEVEGFVAEESVAGEFFEGADPIREGEIDEDELDYEDGDFDDNGTVEGEIFVETDLVQEGDFVADESDAEDPEFESSVDNDEFFEEIDSVEAEDFVAEETDAESIYLEDDEFDMGESESDESVAKMESDEPKNYGIDGFDPRIDEMSVDDLVKYMWKTQYLEHKKREQEREAQSTSSFADMDEITYGDIGRFLWGIRRWIGAAIVIAILFFGGRFVFEEIFTRESGFEEFSSANLDRVENGVYRLRVENFGDRNDPRREDALVDFDRDLNILIQSENGALSFRVENLRADIVIERIRVRGRLSNRDADDFYRVDTEHRNLNLSANEASIGIPLRALTTNRGNEVETNNWRVLRDLDEFIENFELEHLNLSIQFMDYEGEGTGLVRLRYNVIFDTYEILEDQRVEEIAVEVYADLENDEEELELEDEEDEEVAEVPETTSGEEQPEEVQVQLPPQQAPPWNPPPPQQTPPPWNPPPQQTPPAEPTYPEEADIPSDEEPLPDEEPGEPEEPDLEE